MHSKLKEILLTELGTLTYAENKRVRDRLDAEFIQRELASVNKHMRLEIIRIAMSLLFAAVMFTAILTKGTTGMNLWSFFILSLGFAGAAGSGYQLASLSKRKLVYRILQALAEDASESTVSSN